ncbi:MAG: class I SAM-dependent methyltransferase [Ignavibacteriaceae bacterium]|nr:class I SAM-dependent methyltransferase [Ignavibacteriaceae bacterium]HRN26802.1 class I SAM-dependent methyltransferase [Ignavibacteriaceae bacterium]HRP94131.1 class I SAM-dependent methyltransferase [Ignavibacteriaceae bacterium]HRQ54912.1 class I SAM-dependent methyltransferase [Ignavibacteriaceae bacterium]
MSKDYFKLKAESYDSETKRVNNVDNIANSIISSISFNRDMQIMDFGSGTGLLLERVAPFVKKITAVDVSESMCKQLGEKIKDLGCEVEILQMDLTKTKLETKFDAIVSSMTMHHIKDIQAMFNDFYNMLNDNGTIAISDLDIEDGTFHTEDTGVFHFGFDRNEFQSKAIAAGFKNVKIITASIDEKPHGKYPVFLLTGNK